jgi:hypothetical protein
MIRDDDHLQAVGELELADAGADLARLERMEALAEHSEDER